MSPTRPDGLELQGHTYPHDIERIRQIPICKPKAPVSAYDWLTSGAAKQSGLAELLDGTMARLAEAGVPIDRATLHMGTLHPQLVGFAAMWLPNHGVCDEVRVNAHVQETDVYLKSPLRSAIEEGKPLRLRPQDESAERQFPMMEMLAVANFTDYWVVPLPHVQGLFNVVAMSTRSPGGFSAENIEAITAVLPVFALNLEIVALTQIAENLLAAYLGERSGSRVLAGEIKRGAGELIDAIVWVSDMRGFTSLSDRIPEPHMIRLLDAYFEGLVQAVHEHGGEVLKFMGDGMLAIFPLGASPAEAASQALAAAKAAIASMEALNDAEEDRVGIPGKWRPLDMGIALHRGSVFYGNIGAHDRLDFTVTGPAVNLAARVEPLAKETGRRLLLTEAVAELLDEPLEPLGAFSFRGVEEPIAVFTAPERQDGA